MMSPGSTPRADAASSKEFTRPCLVIVCSMPEPASAWAARVSPSSPVVMGPL